VQTAKGKRGANGIVEGIRLAECPVSYITPESAEMVSAFVEARAVREETGSPFRIVTARMFDAAKLIRQAENMAQRVERQAVENLK
jgi:hypothetical protein